MLVMNAEIDSYLDAFSSRFLRLTIIQRLGLRRVIASPTNYYEFLRTFNVRFHDLQLFVVVFFKNELKLFMPDEFETTTL